jgi:ATP-dependent exoDNAse (exonuclease V) beta subunit
VNDRFNAEQREAVERSGRVFVSAGAGTGKTAVLVERVLRRFRDGTPHRPPPRDHVHRPGRRRASPPRP